MRRRHIRAAARGDDWGCCPVKPVRPVQREIVTGVHYKTSQTTNKNPDVPYSTVQAPWSGELGGRAPSSSTDPVTAAAGLRAAGTTGARWVPIYAVVAPSVVIAALISALVAVLVRRWRRRRQRQLNSASGSDGGDGQWNKKLAGILTPTHRNLVHQQPKSTTTKVTYDDARSQNAASSAVSSALSSKRQLTSNQRYGYTPLPGSVYPAATASTKQRRDPNPYGLPLSQCSYQPERVKFVVLKRKRTIDSQTGDVDAGDHDEDKELSPSRQYSEVDNETPATNDLQALLPLNSIKSLFGVVSGVFGIAPAEGAGQRRSYIDRRSSIAVPHVDAPPSASAARLTSGHINDAKAELRRNCDVVTQPIDVSRDMGANTSVDAPPLTCSDVASSTPVAVQSTPNDCGSLSSGDALDNLNATSLATLASSTASPSAVASDLDAVPAGSDDTGSHSTPSLRQSVAEKWSMDSDISLRRQSAQSTGSSSFDATSRQTTTTLERIGGLADAIGLGELVRSVTGNQPTEADKVEPFWVPPGLQIQKRRAQSLQSSLPLSQFEASNANAKNGKKIKLICQTCS